MTAAPPLLFVKIPEVPSGASFEFHPISRGQHPTRYRPRDLLDRGHAKTDWLVFFEEVLLGLYWKIGGPVPYMFRVADGTVRSLDAGCIKWLLNRRPPELLLSLDHAGYIDTVTPTADLRARHEAARDVVVAQLSARKAGNANERNIP